MLSQCSAEWQWFIRKLFLPTKITNQICQPIRIEIADFWKKMMGDVAIEITHDKLEVPIAAIDIVGSRQLMHKPTVGESPMRVGRGEIIMGIDVGRQQHNKCMASRN